MDFETPILFLIYNRPGETEKVFDAIRRIKPTKIFIAADGPNPLKIGDDELCDKTRSTVLEKIDWPAEVKTNFLNSNLGCGRAVSRAISWFFDEVGEGIILEDDCLPSDTFFYWCEYCLKKYIKDDSISAVSGTNFLLNRYPRIDGYYRSHISGIWGWATWRSRWDLFDFEMIEFDELAYFTILNEIFRSKPYSRHITNITKLVKDGEIDTWDIQWLFSIYKRKNLTLMPNKNLVTNIGKIGAHHKLNENPFLDLEKHEFDNKDYQSPKSEFANKKNDDIWIRHVLKYELSGKNILRSFFDKFRLFEDHVSKN